MNSGTYILCIRLRDPVDTVVGSLGSVSFPGGWYMYVGSALGPGGFSRVARHRELARGERATVHWHIDHLLTAEFSRLSGNYYFPDMAVECAIASRFDGAVVTGFGATDCGCSSHLAHFSDQGEFRRWIDRLIHSGLHPDTPDGA